MENEQKMDLVVESILKKDKKVLVKESRTQKEKEVEAKKLKELESKEILSFIPKYKSEK